MKFVFVYITTPNQKKAEETAKFLLEKRLIGCANIFPVRSFYWWKSKIINEKEHVLVGKTKEKNYKRIVEEVEKIYPYSVPCVAKLPISFNEKYKRWLIGEISG